MIYWSHYITFYLFSAGISAGAMIVSLTSGFINRNKYERIVRMGAYIAPFPIMAGMALLIVDLERPQMFWLLLTTFKYSSIMSVGAWIISLFSIVSILYFMLNLPKDYLRLSSMARAITMIKSAGFVLSTSVALYTGLLLSTLAARPLWNTPIIPVLLFISAVLDGLAAISLVLLLTQIGRKDASASDKFMHTVDFMLLYLLSLATVVFLVGMGRSTQSAASALGIVMSGRFGALFWFGFVAAGVAIPLIAAAYRLLMKRQGQWFDFITASLALMGGYILRSVIIEAGQTAQAVLY
ncbi:MAG: polysulfide reductase NrfD [Candidatus Magnetominusculus sp. LBB02]|nr:polysulfide reductase NrfD [Candidatus Magnetominusculus sp. LBB02]